MKDETYVFISDVKEKGSVARSARGRRTHTGKGGRAKLPSDYMTKKELEAMNGEVKSFRLNSPMSWSEFTAMPDDLKVTYIKLLKEKFGAPDCKIGEMMGVNKSLMSYHIKRLGLGHGVKHGGYKTWDSDGFNAWVHGVPNSATAEPAKKEEVAETTSLEVFSEPVVAPISDEKAIPCSGSMTFTGDAEAALKTMISVLGSAKVTIDVCWHVLTEE